MGLSSSAWISVSSYTQEIKESLDHSLTLLDGNSRKWERKRINDVTLFVREVSFQEPVSFMINKYVKGESSKRNLYLIASLLLFTISPPLHLI